MRERRKKITFNWSDFKIQSFKNTIVLGTQMIIGIGLLLLIIGGLVMIL